MHEKITMHHPKTGGTATVSVRSFELVWSKKGWRPARTAPAPTEAHPEPDEPADNPQED